MRKAVGPGERGYVVRLAVLLAVTALVAGGAMCSQTVTMQVSPANAGTTIPSGTVSADRASEFEIEASAGAGYEFVNWTMSFPITWVAGYSATDNPSKFQIPGVDVTVTANFQQRGSSLLSQTAIISGPESATVQPQDEWQEL